MSPKKILFEHVPKCGGTSIVNYLVSHYGNDQVYYIRGDRARAYIDHFKRLTGQERNKYRLIFGHGAHHLLECVAESWIKLTVLRNPVQRIISHYHYVLRTPDHYLYQKVTSEGLTLKAYATRGLSGELRNNLVCRFTGLAAEDAERHPEDSVERAIQTLREKYDVVGVLAHLEAAMDLLKEKAGFTKAFGSRKLNSTRYQVPLASIPESTKSAIAEVNSLDMRLYERVLSIAPKEVGHLY